MYPKRYGGPFTRLYHSQVVALIGAHDIDDPYEIERVAKTLSDVIVHEEWNPLAERYDADIAILILETKVQFTTYIQPVCLGSSETPLLVEDAIVAGWGKSNDKRNFEPIPKYIKIRIQNNEDCFLAESELAKISSKRTLCAGSSNGAGVCLGDSGGGLFVNDGGYFYLQGIVSASQISTLGDSCTITTNAVYTKVLEFKSWIQEYLNLEGEVDLGVEEKVNYGVEEKANLGVEEKLNITVPQNQVDIVVVCDETLATGIVFEMINELNKNLGNNGITDVHIAAIKYQNNSKTLQRMTNIKNLVLNGSSGFNDEDLNKSLKTIQNLEMSSDKRAFVEATKYPFRMAAAKIIILFKSDAISEDSVS